MILASLVLSCTCTPPPSPPADRPVPAPIAARSRTHVDVALTEGGVPGFPDLRASSARSLKLHHLDAKATLPDVLYPPRAEGVTDTFVMEHEELPNPRNAPRQLRVLRAPLPFPVASDDQTFRPSGMQVRIGGEVIPFSRVPAPQARRSTWRINGKHLIVSHPTVPEAGEIEVVYPGVRQLLDRHHPERSGLSEADFLRWQITLQRRSRNGLLLVAPTALEWELTLPPGEARFDTHLAMEASPLVRPRSDGATVVLSVVADGETTEVARKQVPGITKRFGHWEVDLGAWAGQSVTLRLSAEPGENPIFDWVFLGAPTVWGPPEGDVRRVIVVGLDTTRPDHLSFFGYPRNTTPELDAFASSAMVFERTWSTAPRTRPSFRSATTGRRPLEAVGAENLGEVFSARGFATAGFVANPHLQPRFDFSDGYDTWLFDGRANASTQVERALGWLQANLERDSFLFLHVMDPHMVYDAPEPFRDRFVEDADPDLPKRVRRAEVFGWMKQGPLSERRRAHLEALHDGELAYTSHELGRLFDEIDRLPGRSVVILHTDHGEEFWEHDGFEHNHTLYDELTRVVLMIRPRGGLPEGKRISTPASLMDIAPTLYDLLGFGRAPASDGISLVPLMKADDPSTVPGAQRPLPVGHLQYSHERWGVVVSGHKYILHTGTGREELYDLTADPDEKSDLSGSTNLDAFRTALKEAHDIAVGPGWRIRFDVASAPEPVTIDLPVPAVLAGILDPEAVVEKRANVEWGEVPKRLPQDLGTVSLSADRRKLTLAPGPSPSGVAYVIFDAEQAPAGAAVRVGDTSVELDQGPRGLVWRDGDRSVLLDPGIVVVPPPTEADRMGIGPGASGASDEIEMLCQLGYVTEGC